jgi:hypothetical protein
MTLAVNATRMERRAVPSPRDCTARAENPNSVLILMGSSSCRAAEQLPELTKAAARELSEDICSWNADDARDTREEALREEARRLPPAAETMPTTEATLPTMT